ncbi:MAG: exopolysaccharide Pel transporter PelG [Candidatus Eremiobacteraeota bacterium]|nr:exopolysaccharide Pel transporter PelG [Candidatus Eremiobacteraeota bacterium]MCW5872620.1 exopolysaccharide Pel transporter PelG [Candidatus Eremiobacteraeota bacterium]
MAGIGFKLRRLTQDESLLGYFQGYISAGLICCGPWILTVLTLSLADLFFAGFSAGGRPNLFRLLIVYVFAFSLVTTGGLQTVVTRYLADRLYAEDPHGHVPTYAGLCLLNSPIQALLAGLGLGFLPMPVAFKAAGISLYVLVCNLWLLMIFLGAVRAYASILAAFALGGLASLGLMWALSDYQELGLLLGFSGGQAVAYLWMLRLLLREFPSSGPAWNFSFLIYFRKYPALGVGGWLLNLGAWIGVFVYWMSSYATVYYGLPSYYPYHDVAVFLALLSIIPALVIFFVRVETDFYESYRAFFGGITTNKVPYSELQRRKAEMVDTLRAGFASLLQVQGLVSLLVAAFPEVIFSFMKLPPETLEMTRNCAAGAFFLVIFQCLTTILLYYQAYSEVALSALVLVVGNLAGALASLWWGQSSHGLGLLVGSLPGLLLAYRYLLRVVRNLERITFMQQPMPGQLRLEKQEAASAFGQTLMKDGVWIGGKP